MIRNVNKGRTFATTSASEHNKGEQSKRAKNKNLDLGSAQTLSIQIYEFLIPNEPKNAKGIMNIKHATNLLQTEKSQSDAEYDLTSSINSHNGDGVFPVLPMLSPKFKSPTNIQQELTTSSINTFDEMSGKVRTSIEMFNSRRTFSEKPKQFKGPEWRQPCKESLVAGIPPKFIGTCAPNIEKLSKMSRKRQKFFLTQDPRKVQCLVNPDILRAKGFSKKKEFETFSIMVKHAQNTCDTEASSENADEQFQCEVIDLENPFQLDFQGLDYKNTFQKDEQDIFNQRNYLRLCRYMDRKKIKIKTQIQVEEEKYQEKLQVPVSFKIRERLIPDPPSPPKEPKKLAKLLRSDGKPCNRRKINMEQERREKRYKDLYLKFRARRQEEEQATKGFKTEEEKNRQLIMADKKFEDIVDEINAVVKRNYKKETKADGIKGKAKIATPSKTMGKSVKKFNKKAENFDFKQYDKDSHLRVSVEKNANNITLGKDGDFFMLRGFDTDASKSVKGRFLKPESGMIQGCKTRYQWLMELAPKKEKVKLDVEVGIQPLRSLDDPKLPLFDPNISYKPPKHEMSEVKAFTLKPLGHHYDKMLRKSIRYSKPRLKYNVKKFNLVRYRFSDTAKKPSEKKIDIAEFEQSAEKISTMEYIEEKVAKRRKLQEEGNMKRLELLGIPCKNVKMSQLHTTCELSASSSDSEWVPYKEPDYTCINEEKCTYNVRDIMPLNMRTNMPAPKYREPTLRQHPRHKRNYKDDRVASQILDDVVLKANHPYMFKLPSDAIRHANPNLKVRPYYKIGEAKHHHDHWKPGEENIIDVHYQPILVKPKITEARKKADRISIEKFKEANPPSNRFVDMSLTMPKWNVDAIIQEHRESVELASGKNKNFGTIKIKDICKQRDFVSHSRDRKELEKLDYPGRKEYLQLLRDVKISLDGSIHSEDPSDKLYVNKADSLTDVEENLKSIESCLTSLSSSECTNLTNDSGSFLVMEGKEKVPLDYIRKSLVPFEEIHRSRFQAEPIDVEKEEQNPFNALPFCGQRRAQQKLISPKDSFFTFNTRLKNSLRQRLEVPVEDVRKKLIGERTHKYPGLVATDIDEAYAEVLKCRPPIKRCKFATERVYIKDAMRLKFESMIAQGQIVRAKIFDRLNEQHWTDMDTVKKLYDKLFDKWQKKEYETAMNVVCKVKSFYEETDRLKSEHKNLDKERVILNMDIVFIENHWIRCVMLQNFHYLMGEPEWRIEHDWIHRLPSDDHDKVVRMENFEDSILKRSQVNIRQREKDDAWAIKTYYEKCYLPNKHENLIVFPEPESFFMGLKKLKKQTFELLLEMHFTLTIHTELQGKLETFVQWCADDLKDRKAYVERKYSKFYFTEDRSAWLRNRTLGYLGQSVDNSFKDEDVLRNQGVISEAWRHIVPASMRGSSEGVDAVEIVAMISDVVMELMSKFETIPMDTSANIEKIVRKRRERLMKQSQQAYYVEKRIEHELKIVMLNLEPSSRVMNRRRPSKLPRYYLKKPAKTIEVQKTEISEASKLYFEAFNEVDEDMPITELKDSIIQVGTAVKEQEVPFYFDHFLELNGYKPDYSFKTQVEIRDGPELDRMKVKEVLPEVQRRMVAWEILKRKIMKDHIAQNPQMYVNVV